MIPQERAHLIVTANTHEGMSGKNNEDRYGVSAFTVNEENRIPSLFAIVADGIGGHQAGEIAAEIAVETISQVIANSDASDPQAILNNAIIQASHAVHQQSTKDSAQQGMGSTCVCVWVIGNHLYTAYVGDSRIYLLRGNKIQQITTDHTWVQEAIQYGIITPEQARGHPQSHIIRRYLGSKHGTEPDFRLRLSPEESDKQALANQGMELFPGDQLLLCSDGLTDLVEDEEIRITLNKKNTEAALQHLIDLANQRGGHDNITVVAVEIPGENIPRKKNIFTRSKLFWVAAGLLSILMILIIVGLAFITWRFTRPGFTPTPSLQATLPAIIETSIAPTEIIESSPTVIPPTKPPPPQATYTPWPTSTPKP